jgi:HlyD family secretion protein
MARSKIRRNNNGGNQVKEISMKLSEMSESREVLESKPYPIIIYFIYILLSFLIISIAWMYFSEIDIVVKGNGIIRPVDGVSVVKNKITGKIKEKNLTEGKVVNKGDILFIIEHEEIKATESLLTNEIESETIVLENLKKYKESIAMKENLFDIENEKEKEFYYKYIGFSDNLFSMKETVNFDQSKILDLNEDIRNINLLELSIRDGIDKFDTKNTYSLKFKGYELKIEELNQNSIELKDEYEINQKLFEKDAISENALKLSKASYENSKLKFNQYINAFENDLKIEKEQVNLEMQNLKTGLNKLVANIDSGIENNLPLETKEIIIIDEEITLKEKTLISLKNDLESTKLNIEKCIIKAEIDGVINLKKKISLGDYITGGETIANIIPKNNQTYKVEISMPEREISNIEVGDTIKYRFNSLPYKEYGMLEGKVVTISEDSVFNETNGINSYIIKADVENKPLYSYKGKKANLKIGMTCEAQVITKSKKILFYLLEKIDLW